MVSVILYLLIFVISIFVFSSFIKPAVQNGCLTETDNSRRDFNWRSFLLRGLIAILLLILLYGLRVNIGTDYEGYEEIYNVTHNADFSEYWEKHNSEAKSSFYVEIGYYIINRICPSYRVLLFVNFILIMIPVLLAIRLFEGEASVPLMLFIFWTTQFIYSMNGVRFSIALSLILLSVVFLNRNKIPTYLALVFLACLFHKTAMLSLPFILLMEFDHKKINTIRNIVYIAFIICFAFVNRYIIDVILLVPLFERYVNSETYKFASEMNGSLMWLLHIIPVFAPLFLVYSKRLLHDRTASFLTRVCLAEIPFRMMGLYNTWFTRLARIPQVVQVLLIPYLLGTTKNKRTKNYLLIYYIVWYIFYFIYYIFINDQGDSIPYQWVFGNF